ncbi:MAG: hypothetical protein AAF927_03690 [Bacteroidota bacterium]
MLNLRKIAEAIAAAPGGRFPESPRHWLVILLIALALLLFQPLYWSYFMPAPVMLPAQEGGCQNE